MNEHEFKETDRADVFYPEHAPRTESATFRKTKHDGKAAGDVCAISGWPEKLEYHHVFCEAAFTNAVDWSVVKGVALGSITALPLLDDETGEPVLDENGNPKLWPAAGSLLHLIVMLAAWRGFDWSEFDPTRPETFVDSRANMLPLHERYHRSAAAGMHHLPLPLWIFQAFPRVPGFVFSPAELAARHAKGAA